MVARLAPVMISSQQICDSTEKVVRPTGSVQRVGLVVTISGQMKAVQFDRKVKIARAERAGVTSGMAMVHQIWNSLRPSTRAALRKSSGTVSKNCFMRKVPKAVIMPGNMMPQVVSTQPNFTDIM